MKTLIIALLIGGLLIVGWVSYSKMKDQKLPEVEVWLLQPVSRVKGHAWPMHSDGKPLELAAVEHPALLRVHLPSGKEVEIKAKAIQMDQENGAVTRITPLPLMDLTTFRQAVEEAERLAAQLQVNTHLELKTKLQEWRALGEPTADVFKTYMASTKLEEGVMLYLSVKPHASGQGWFVVVDFMRPVKEQLTH